MKVLAFAASLREQSLNRRLITCAAEIARGCGVEVDLASFREFEMPLYNDDLQQGAGFPAGALELAARLAQAGALLLASPEYNYSIPGVLKNAIDWVSRIRPMPWKGKSVYLMSASPSAAGGIRGLWQTRIPLEACGALVFPDMFALSQADQAFDASGRLRDPAKEERLERGVVGFLRLAEAVAPILTKPVTAKARVRQQEIHGALEEETELQAQPPAAP
jgi:NAD(P)H-dependent FMN reductase